MISGIISIVSLVERREKMESMVEVKHNLMLIRIMMLVIKRC